MGVYKLAVQIRPSPCPKTPSLRGRGPPFTAALLRRTGEGVSPRFQSPHLACPPQRGEGLRFIEQPPTPPFVKGEADLGKSKRNRRNAFCLL